MVVKQLNNIIWLTVPITTATSSGEFMLADGTNWCRINNGIVVDSGNVYATSSTDEGIWLGGVLFPATFFND